MFLEAIAAGIVGVALLWLVLQPILAPMTEPAADLDPPDPEETPQGQALLALKEIEFDRATGKLSESDYDALHARYTAAAIATLDAAQAPSVPAGPSAMSGTAGVHCLEHGPCALADAHFCPGCGAGLVANDGSCAACGHALPADAIFCPGCGVPLRAAAAEPAAR